MQYSKVFPRHALATVSLLAACAVQAQDGGDKEADNGTDPSKVSSSASVQWERVKLRAGGEADTLTGIYVVPVGGSKNKLTFKVPVARNDVLGRGGYDLGDVSVGLSHVYALNKSYAQIFVGEVAFDTARRTELGSGKHVVKGTYIHALFLEGGNIFAPAIVHSLSVGGDDSRPKVNRTALDFYYVPKLPDKKLFMTIDPALSFDWESDQQFASLAVTLGRVMGPAFGGNGQIFVKPSVFIGGERPSQWGIQFGYKVIGF